MAARVTQTGVEVLVKSDVRRARVTQVVVEALVHEAPPPSGTVRSQVVST